MRTRVDMATLTAPARPSTTAPKRSLLVSTHRPHCVRRARAALSPLSLSLKLDWGSFHSRPFLSQLVGSRGVLHRRRQPDVLVLGVVELGSVGNGAHSTPVGTTSQKILCGSTMLSIIRVAAPASLKLSCRTESPRESLAFDIVSVRGPRNPRNCGA